MHDLRNSMGSELRGSSLRDDQRGAVMVVGVFMAAFLVGSLWYIIGIGDAILYRERMQDGADAVAFAAAVYHARGMNIIAMINIIMAAVLAILVAFKLLQLINAIAMAVSCALCATGIGSAVGCPICAATGNLVAPINKAVQSAEKLVKTTLPVLSKTQAGVAMTMPWIAQAKAAYIASQSYTKPVEGGGFLSVSLVPFDPKERLGLPVQEDEYKNLCNKAGQYVGELVFSPFGGFADWVGKVVGSIVSTFPSQFCGASNAGGASSGGGSGASQPAIPQSTIDDLVKKGCEDKKDALPDDEQDDFDMNKCIADGKKEVEEKLEQQNQQAATALSTNNMTPKKVFSAAKNGNDYFQIWSVVVGDDQWPREAERGVQIASWNKSVPNPPAPWGKVAFAQAEYYYDASGKWEDLRDEAMWNMRWRARLRRVRTPDETTAGMLIGNIPSSILSDIDPAVAGALGGAEVMGAILGGQAGSALEAAIGAVHQGGSQFDGALIKNPKLQPFGGVEILH